MIYHSEGSPSKNVTGTKTIAYKTALVLYIFILYLCICVTWRAGTVSFILLQYQCYDIFARRPLWGGWRACRCRTHRQPDGRLQYGEAFADHPMFHKLRPYDMNVDGIRYFHVIFFFPMVYLWFRSYLVGRGFLRLGIGNWYPALGGP